MMMVPGKMENFTDINLSELKMQIETINIRINTSVRWKILRYIYICIYIYKYIFIYTMEDRRYRDVDTDIFCLSL